MKTLSLTQIANQRFQVRLPARSQGEALLLELRSASNQTADELKSWLEAAVLARPKLLPALQKQRLPGAGFSLLADDGSLGDAAANRLIVRLENRLIEQGRRRFKAFRAGNDLAVEGPAGTVAPAAILLHRQVVTRQRPVPQSRITYDVETGGAIEKRELPFVIGVLADLSGDVRPDAPLKGRRMIDIDRDNFDDVLKVISPAVDLSAIDNVLPGSTTPKLAGLLRFASLADFKATAVASRVEGLSAFIGSPAGFRQLSLIRQSPAFLALEASWRGLHRLVSRTQTGPLLKIKVLNTSRQELLDDLQRAVSFDQSGLFKLIYEAEYGTFGGTPYSLLVGAFEFGGDAASIEGLKQIAAVAAATHAPFICAASAALFGLNSFADLSRPRDLVKIFESSDLIGWQAFRESEDARYVSLALPRVLMRLPSEGSECVSIGDDPAAPPAHEHLLWGNPAFLLAEVIAGAFGRHHWPAAFRGVQSGGLLGGLPCFDRKDGPRIGPTEIPISDHRMMELDALGLVPLCQRKNTDQAAFFCAQSAGRQPRFLNDETNTAVQRAASLPFILAASRFAHYIKVIMREKAGSFLTRGNVGTYLNTWISQYVLLDDQAPEEIRATYPLRAASITVTDVPGQPGAYRATVFLQPTFQLPELTTAIRIVADLPS